MTRPKVPTIAELNKAAKRIDPNAYVETFRAPWRGLSVWALPVNINSIADSPKARRFILGGLRALPSAPTPKKRKGAKR